MVSIVTYVQIMDCVNDENLIAKIDVDKDENKSFSLPTCKFDFLFEDPSFLRPRFRVQTSRICFFERGTRSTASGPTSSSSCMAAPPAFPPLPAEAK